MLFSLEKPLNKEIRGGEDTARTRKYIVFSFVLIYEGRQPRAQKNIRRRTTFHSSFTEERTTTKKMSISFRWLVLFIRQTLKKDDNREPFPLDSMRTFRILLFIRPSLKEGRQLRRRK